MTPQPLIWKGGEGDAHSGQIDKNHRIQVHTVTNDYYQVCPSFKTALFKNPCNIPCQNSQLKTKTNQEKSERRCLFDGYSRLSG